MGKDVWKERHARSIFACNKWHAFHQATVKGNTMWWIRDDSKEVWSKAFKPFVIKTYGDIYMILRIHTETHIRDLQNTNEEEFLSENVVS